MDDGMTDAIHFNARISTVNKVSLGAMESMALFEHNVTRQDESMSLLPFSRATRRFA